MSNLKAYHPSMASQISHELRIPLTGIMRMANFLKETPLTSEQQDYLQSILTSANRLLSLESKIHNILKVSSDTHIS